MIAITALFSQRNSARATSTAGRIGGSIGRSIGRSIGSTVARNQSSGFILVATLFALAIIAVGAAYFATRVDVLREGALQQQALAEAEREVAAIGHALMETALTNPATERGLFPKDAPDDPLILDGRFYRMTEKSQISIQDERGLISLNIIDDNQLRKVLSAMGLPAERHDRLIDTLRDYIDVDDLRRLNGAEKRDYLDAKLPLPANDFLVSRDELRRIPGWRELLAELDARGKPGAAERFLSYFTTHRSATVNVNAAPRLVLSTVAGIDPSKLGLLVDHRLATPFSNFGELGPYTNGPIDWESVVLVGANNWRLTYQRDDLGFLIECRLKITPAAIHKASELSECRHRPQTSIIADDDVEDFARVFGDKFSGGFSGAAELINNSVKNNAKNSAINYPQQQKGAAAGSGSLFTDQTQSSLRSPYRSPYLSNSKREINQRAPDSRKLAWLKRQAGLDSATFGGVGIKNVGTKDAADARPPQ